MSHLVYLMRYPRIPIGKTIRLAAIVGFSLIPRRLSVELDQFFHRYFHIIHLSHLSLLLIAH